MDSFGIVAGTWPPIQKDSPDAAFVHCRQVSQSAQCPETDMFSWLLLARRERSTPARSWPSENFPHRLALIFTTLFFERANASMPQHPKQEAKDSNLPTSLAALYHQPPGATRGGKPCCRPPPPPYYCPYLCPYCTPRKTVLPTSHTGYAAAAAAAAAAPAPGGAAAASRGIGRGKTFSGCALHCRRARARESSHLGAAEGAVVCYEITADRYV